MTTLLTCPECEQGKHTNCTGWALDTDDREVQCMCDCQIEQRTATVSWLPAAPEGAVAPTAIRCCRVCGCTDDKACLPPAGPCHWVELDLCSACEPKEPTC